MMSILFYELNQKMGLRENNNSVLFKEMYRLYENYSKNILSEKDYNLKKDKMIPEKKKKYPTFQVFSDREKIYSAVACYFIIMQLNVDTLQKSQEFGRGSCKYSLDGYPVKEDAESTAGISYMSCILNLLKNPDTSPWNALQKPDSMQKRILDIVGHVVKNNEWIQQKINKRRDELRKLETRAMILQEDMEEDVGTTVYSTWSQFLPPLVPYNDLFDKKLTVSETKIQLFEDDRKPNLLEMKSYDNILALLMYASINAAILGKSERKNNKIMFKETMCCDDRPENNHFRNPLLYFQNDNPTIKSVHSQSQRIGKLITNLQSLQKAGFMSYQLPFHFSSNMNIAVKSATLKKVIQQHQFSLRKLLN